MTRMTSAWEHRPQRKLWGARRPVGGVSRRQKTTCPRRRDSEACASFVGCHPRRANHSKLYPSSPVEPGREGAPVVLAQIAVSPVAALHSGVPRAAAVGEPAAAATAVVVVPAGPSEKDRQRGATRQGASQPVRQETAAPTLCHPELPLSPPRFPETAGPREPAPPGELSGHLGVAFLLRYGAMPP